MPATTATIDPSTAASRSDAFHFSGCLIDELMVSRFGDGF